MSVSSSLSPVGACAFRTMMLHKRPHSLFLGILSLRIPPHPSKSLVCQCFVSTTICSFLSQKAWCDSSVPTAECVGTPVAPVSRHFPFSPHYVRNNREDYSMQHAGQVSQAGHVLARPSCYNHASYCNPTPSGYSECFLFEIRPRRMLFLEVSLSSSVPSSEFQHSTRS
jgi:hypothetical protein